MDALKNCKDFSFSARRQIGIGIRIEMDYDPSSVGGYGFKCIQGAPLGTTEASVHEVIRELKLAINYVDPEESKINQFIVSNVSDKQSAV